MMRRITTGSPFEAEFAYSRAVVQGDWCFVAGTTGYDYATMTMPRAPARRPRRRSPRSGGRWTRRASRWPDVVRTVIYLVDPRRPSRPSDRRCAAAWARCGRRTRPWSAALLRPEMKVEIEVTAITCSAVCG
jgi:enamine deaminase RidA (YjgF/YER057c/UK114 family)